LKYSFLVSACIFLAGFNYLSYVKAADETKKQTCDTAIDTDCDELTNTEEKLYATNPNNSDSDGDGYSDGAEVKSGYDPLKPAPGDRIVEAVKSSSESISQNTPADSSVTDNFIQNFQQFISSKDGEAISVEDINNFTNTELSGKIVTTTIETLPEVDKSQIKILPQTYSELSAEKRKEQIQIDAVQYLYEVAYLLGTNAPKPILSQDDFNAFKSDFENRLADLTDQNNLEYFSDLGNRLDVFSIQINNLTVPESMLELHIKFTRIVKGFLALQGNSSSTNNDDPMEKIILLTTTQNLINIFSNFVSIDLLNYFKSIS